MEKITITEKNIRIETASDLIFRLIEDQIKSYNQQKMIAWEQNHQLPNAENELIINYLVQQKNRLKELLKSPEVAGKKVDYEFALNIKIHSND